MTADSTHSSYDAIVIGSGMGGLACACALTRMGRRVLVLEQHIVAGGLTQTFARDGFRWDVGVHYLGAMGAGGAGRKVLDWLSDGAIHFNSMGPVYDTVHFPDNFHLQFARPEEALKLELTERFADSRAELDAFFAALVEAERASRPIFVQRVLPMLLASLYRFWHKARIEKWWGRSTETVLEELISDPKLRAVLAAQRGDYGPLPSASSFGMHAIIMRHYFSGAYYPTHGAKVFAEALVPVIEKGGGAVKVRAQVSRILVENGATIGIRLENGTDMLAPRVFSDAGAHNTVTQLLPPELRESAWAREIASFEPSACYLALYLGLQGDVRARGGTSSNHWFYETWDLDGGVWRDPVSEPMAPAMFVSFPSLKDPEESARTGKHTAEVVAFTDWAIFKGWEDSKIGRRPADYLELKRVISDKLIAQFGRYFPALAPLVVHSELSTPLSNIAFTGGPHGGAYGLDTSPRRFLTPSLRVKTPVPGLYLTGQDVTSPGITGAMMGGVLAAAAIEPRVFRHLR
jgi:phytoene dehydrogenase-like protein